ncbi:CD99 antigen-like protein 2 isoform X2 [Physeter macrocephalus]|uniref:CD99 antigen-like protein 2 n=1 Tax=Physeter macrocephalus TaxID=9755 RepID=A0A455APC0_PHYMC|nr:CD99 antigen-like protein 2 isoform X2 [Physeter catodon]|eukprot:XP_028338422.1 CD99 antigen-like protein 2 isoform X2 [Physeter catodon]
MVAWHSAFLISLAFSLATLVQRGSGDVGFSLEDALEETSSVKQRWDHVTTTTRRPGATRAPAKPAGSKFDLADALDDQDHGHRKPSAGGGERWDHVTTTTRRPGATRAPAKPAGSKFDLADALDDQDHGHRKPSAGGGERWDHVTTTTRRPGATRAPAKPAEKEFDLADALDDRNDQDHGHRKPSAGGGGFSDKDLEDILGGGEYKPDKGKGAGQYGSGDDSGSGVSAETSTIAGVASALAMALIGAVSSYISYQQKKFCFSIQRKWTCPAAASGCTLPLLDGNRGARALEGKGQNPEQVKSQETSTASPTHLLSRSPRAEVAVVLHFLKPLGTDLGQTEV